MAPESRRLPALQEDLSSVPSTHMVPLTTTYNSSFKRSDAPFWLPWALAHVRHTFTQIKINLRISGRQSPRQMPTFNEQGVLGCRAVMGGYPPMYKVLGLITFVQGRKLRVKSLLAKNNG